jgi:hypothetical protein
MSARTWRRGDLVQIASEAAWNNSCFRIKRIYRGNAILGQLDPDSDRYCGVDTEISVSNPELVAPSAAILAMYSRHVKAPRS